MLVVFTKNYRKIGILGGMGPEATAQLYLEIIKIFQDKYGAKYDDDFPEIVILNLPIPDVVENSESRNIVRDKLIYGVKKLETVGADFIAIPCNTVTFYLEDMQKNASIPIINIVEEIKKLLQELGVKKYGVLATKSTINSKLYEDNDKVVFNPNTEQQEVITNIVMNILSGKKKLDEKNKLVGFISEMNILGAEKVVLGCTELPLLIDNEDTINTIKVLAKACVRECMKKTNGDEKNER